MAVGDYTQKWGTASTFTHGIASMATSSTKLVGWETSELTITGLAPVVDVELSVKVTTGTSPTTAKSIEVWAIACNPDLTYPSVFDGTSSAETIPSAEQKLSLCRVPVAIFATNATSDTAYEAVGISLLGIFGYLPAKIVLFITHDTGVNLNATAGNHVFQYRPIYSNVA